jgi:hypothetical protein
MSFRGLLTICVLVALSAWTSIARAQCCPGYNLATACAGQTLTKSFCAYGDKVISTLEEVFNIPAPSTFEFELDTQTGGAHTGTACQNLGDGVAFDAFAIGATCDRTSPTSSGRALGQRRSASPRARPTR